MCDVEGEIYSLCQCLRFVFFSSSHIIEDLYGIIVRVILGVCNVLYEYAPRCVMYTCVPMHYQSYNVKHGMDF